MLGRGDESDAAESDGDNLAGRPACGAENNNGSSNGGSTARASSRPRPRGRLLPIVKRLDGNAEGFRSGIGADAVTGTSGRVP